MPEFEEIYRAYFADVYRYVLALSRDTQVAEEVTQETFFRALTAIDSFRGQCQLRVWLCQIARNCYISSLRKEKRTAPQDELPEQADGSASPEELLTVREEARRIQAILHDLPEPYREVFMWRVFADLSYKQIGEIFSKTDNWACVTYHRARKMIKNRLEDSSYEE